MKKHQQVKVSSLPKCDFCDALAQIDGKTNFGSWANMCGNHFFQHGVGLGLGRGQRLVLSPPRIKKLAEIPESWLGTC
jgi:hypothetical protein